MVNDWIYLKNFNMCKHKKIVYVIKTTNKIFSEYFGKADILRSMVSTL